MRKAAQEKDSSGWGRGPAQGGPPPPPQQQGLDKLRHPHPAG